MVVINILIIKDLKAFIVKNKMIFILFLLVQVVTLVGLFCAINNFEQSIDEEIKIDSNYRTYQVVTNNKNYNFDSLDILINKFDKLEKVDFVKPFNDDINYCYEYLCNYNDTFIYLGRGLTSEEVKNGSNKIVLPFEMCYDYKVGDTYSVNDKEYTIVGISLGNNFILPYNSIKNTDEEINILFVTNDKLNKKEKNNLFKLIDECFEDYQIIKPINVYINYSLSNVLEMILYVLLLFLGIINLVYLYSYILEKRKKQYAILRICGCTRLKGIAIYLCEILLIALISYVFAILLFKFIVIQVIAKVDIYTTYSMQLISYLYALLIYLLITILVLFPYIKKYAYKPIADSYKG